MDFPPLWRNLLSGIIESTYQEHQNGRNLGLFGPSVRYIVGDDRLAAEEKITSVLDHDEKKY